jgi:AbrB family looped-hinge helix DNA binding protein
MGFDKSNGKYYNSNIMIYTATITSQGQVTIPAPVRDFLDLSKSKRVNFVVKDKQIFIEPEPDILSLRGVFKTKKKIPFWKARKAFEEALGKGQV